MPLGYFTVAIASCMVSGLQTQILPAADRQAVALVVLPAFVLQIIVAAFAFADRDAAAATIMASFAASWLVDSLMLLITPAGAAGMLAFFSELARLWIGGEWVDTADHRDSINPATGEVIGHYAMGHAEDAERAIAIARQAFHASTWKDDRALRARVLNSMAEEFEARSDDFVEIIALENGKIKPEARFEAEFSAPTLRFNAALALADTGRASAPEPGKLDLVVRQAVGVAGVIAPWNSPLALVLRSLAPALAAGCTAVVSLPHQTAQVNYLFAQVLGQVPELPPGVVSVLTGGFDTGDALVRSPDVPAISFTGSSKTGRVISANAAANLKRVGLELGGKHPNIVFDDADLDLAIPTIVSSLTVFAGQFCMTGSRLLVQSGVADEVRNRVARRLETLKVGPAADPDSQMGP